MHLSLIIGEMVIKTTVRYHLTLIILLLITKAKTTRAGRNVEQRNLQQFLVEWLSFSATMEKKYGNLLKN